MTHRYGALALLPCLILAPACTIKITGGDPPVLSDADAGDLRDSEAGSLSDAIPDVTLHAMEDDSYQDFIRGTLSESGAKLYVSANGNVRLLEVNDLDEDGALDLVFASSFDDSHYAINSFIYYGSPTGFSVSRRGLIPSVGAVWSTASDLNADGHPDIVLSNFTDGTSNKQDSYIYWGSAGGYSLTNRANIPTMGAWANSAADLDGDGFLDLVFSNNKDDKTELINSYIYWGSAAGFSAQKRQDLPTMAARDNVIADLNGDGRLDIFFTNETDSVSYHINSYIYWGSASGYSASNRGLIPSVGAQGAAVADLNNDGLLDIVISSHYDGTSYALNSYIYWGDKTGFSRNRRSEIPTQGARGVSVADVDHDGRMDILISNYYDGKTYKINSYLYRGSASGFSLDRRQAFPTVGTYSNAIADLNNDGFLDIAFSNRFDDVLHRTQSHIYWGSKSGFDLARRTGLPTYGAASSNLRNLGSLYHRSAIQTYLSRVHDAGTATPTYTTLSWRAIVPANTSLKIQLRSSTSVIGLQTARWYGPSTTQDFYRPRTTIVSSPINQVHSGHRYIQYQAVFDADFAGTPVLDRVAISYR